MIKSKLTQFSSVLLLASVLLPTVVLGATETIPQAIGLAQGWLGLLVKLFIGIAVVVFMWGAVKFMTADDDAGRSEGRQRLLWGIIGIFVMVSIWGLINFIDKSLDLDDAAPTTLPEPPPLP